MPDKPPDDKDGLLELLKKLWLPVAAFIGAVTLAYNFYQLWLGDQATVTYFLAGGGLLILVIVFAWVGFTAKPKHKERWRRYLQKHEKIPAYPSHYRLISQIALLLILIGLIIGGKALIQQRQIRENKLVVLIAIFEGPEDVYGLRNEIIESLNADFSNDKDIQITSIDEVITLTQGSDYARQLGERYLADVVIWGWYRPTENPNITIHLENLSPQLITIFDQSATFKPSTTLDNLKSFSYQQQLGGETTALINFLAGLIQFEVKEYSAAISLFDKSLANIENSKLSLITNFQYPVYYYRGAANYFLEQYDQAIADYTKVIQLDPQDAIAHYDRGIIYNDLKKYNQAIADYTKAIQLDPQYAMAYYNRGNTHNKLKQYNPAIDNYSKAIQLDPQLAAAYNNRGGTYVYLNQYDQAIADYTKVIQLDLQDADTYNNRGITYTYLKQYDLAIADFSMAIQLNPQDANAYNYRGIAYGNLKQYDLAIADYSIAIQLDPYNADAYTYRGKTYTHLERHNEAVADYTIAIQLGPQDADAYTYRGTAYAVLKQYDQAFADLSKSIQLNPQNVRAYFTRGDIYFNLKQYNQAIDNYSKVIQLDPYNADAYQIRIITYLLLGKTTEAEADQKKHDELIEQKP